MQREKEACHCKNITYGMLEDVVKNGAKTYDEAEKFLHFGTGCGNCRDFIRHFINNLVEQE